MTANAFTRGTCPGRARPHHRGSFARGHAKRGGRQKGTPNAISPRARKAIAAAAKRLARGTHLIRHYWQRLIDPNPLITEALERQGTFTLGGAPRLRSRPFNMKSFCKDLSAVAMRAIKTDQFVDRDLVECLTLLGVRAPSEFAKFLTLLVPKRSYLAARPHAEVLEPREAVNPGEYRHPPIPEWTLSYDLTLNSYTLVPVDQALTPQDADHEVCGSPLNPAPGWDWKFDNETRIALRPKTRIPEWTQRFDPKLGSMIPVPVGLDPNQDHHPEYGSPLDPAPEMAVQFRDTALATVNFRSDRFSTPQRRRLYRWRPDQGHFSLVREDDDDGEEYDLYEYDPDFGRRGFFKRYSRR